MKQTTDFLKLVKERLEKSLEGDSPLGIRFEVNQTISFIEGLVEALGVTENGTN